MTYAADFLHLSDASRRELCLGLALGTREVGLGVATATHLAHHQILNLRKLHSTEAKDLRFRQAIRALLDRHDVTVLAVVRLDRTRSANPLTDAQATWIAGEAEARGLPLVATDAADLLRRLLPNAKRPTSRLLPAVLAARYPVLARRTPESEPAPGALHLPEFARQRRAYASPREKYWKRTFLAVGAAVDALERRSLRL